MTDIAAMLEAYPAPLDHIDQDALVVFVHEALNCAHTCMTCADACLAEPGRAHLARCVSVALVCADLCSTAVRTVSLQTGHDAVVTRALLEACVEACRACYDECGQHALEHEHCRICAEACRRCANACRELLSTMK